MTNILKQYFLPALLLLALSLYSCDPNRVYERNIDLPDYRWDEANKLSFDVEITDTTQLYNIYITLRHNFYYQFSNIWLIVETRFPDGQALEQRIQIELADKEGKWYSDCSGDICDFRGLIQENAYFNKPGTYTFTIAQNMRVNPLPNIMSVGIRIEKTEETREIVDEEGKTQD